MSTNVRLHGKTIVVTGGTGQVGFGIARAALAAGGRVVLPVRAGSSRGGLPEGEAVLVVECDLTEASGASRLRDEAMTRFGGVDHVAAPLGGWWQKGHSLDQDATELRDLLAVYVEAQWLLVKALAPALRVARGSYTFVTGAAGEGQVPRGGLLVTAVNAQYALSRVLRHELREEPFRVNEVRIACRIERAPRPGVVTSDEAGADFLAVIGGGDRGEIFRYGADRSLTRAGTS